MNDVTFFRNRNTDQGDTSQFNVANGNVSHRFFIYVARRTDSAPFTDQEVPQKGMNDFVKTLQGQVTSRGGGIIVRITEDGGWKTMEVRPVPSPAYRPPGHVIALAPGVPAYSVPIEDKQKFPAGAHIVVPIDEDAEVRLVSFVGQLPWFSPDLEALVLNAIRRPSLDARLNQVENRVFGQTTDGVIIPPNATRWMRFKLQLLPWFSKPATNTALIAVVLSVLLLTAGVPLLLSVIQGIRAATSWIVAPIIRIVKPSSTTTDTSTASDTSSAGTTSTSSTSDTSQSNTNTRAAEPEVPKPEASKLAAQTRELLKELKKRESNPDFKSLYEVHFQKHGDNKEPDKATDQEIESWYSGGGIRPFLCGLIKLQILKLQSNTADKTQPQDNTVFLKTSNAGPATKEAFKKASNRDQDPFVGALACRMAIPPTEFALTTKCDERVADENIKQGLDQLIKFVKKP